MCRTNGRDDATPRQLTEMEDNNDDLYGLLNVDRSASEETIQKSYKTLSRSLHPDKQPRGIDVEATNNIFVAFKNARTSRHCCPLFVDHPQPI